MRSGWTDQVVKTRLLHVRIRAKNILFVAFFANILLHCDGSGEGYVHYPSV